MSSLVPVLSAHNLACVRNQRLLFAKVNFTVGGGEMLRISGANGAGKSSLLQILCGLRRPQQGQILWNQCPLQELAVPLQQQLVYIGHKLGIKAELTVLENLQFACCLNQRQPGVSWEAALQRLEMHPLAEAAARSLSAGQRQRLALAQLLVRDALIWVLDEPFTAMDAKGVNVLQEMIEEHLAANRMIILTTHRKVDLPQAVIHQVALN